MRKCSIIGHRKLELNNSALKKLESTICNLITNHGITDFLFGSKSDFNQLCYDIITNLKKNYSFIRRIFVRAEYPVISDEYRKYLLTLYEDTYFYDSKKITSRYGYIKRNELIIRNSDICLFYYNSNYLPKKKQSGTKLAYEYAIKKNKNIINFYN